MVYVDSRSSGPSYSGAEGEECDSEDVVTADVAHGHEESSRRQRTCRERRMEVWEDEQRRSVVPNAYHTMAAILRLGSALPDI